MKNIAKEKILNNELCLGVGLRQSRTVDIGKIMATSGMIGSSLIWSTIVWILILLLKFQ